MGQHLPAKRPSQHCNYGLLIAAAGSADSASCLFTESSLRVSVVFVHLDYCVPLPPSSSPTGPPGCLLRGCLTGAETICRLELPACAIGHGEGPSPAAVILVLFVGSEQADLQVAHAPGLHSPRQWQTSLYSSGRWACDEPCTGPFYSTTVICIRWRRNVGKEWMPFCR